MPDVELRCSAHGAQTPVMNEGQRSCPACLNGEFCAVCGEPGLLWEAGAWLCGQCAQDDLDDE